LLNFNDALTDLCASDRNKIWVKSKIANYNCDAVSVVGWNVEAAVLASKGVEIDKKPYKIPEL